MVFIITILLVKATPIIFYFLNRRAHYFSFSPTKTSLERSPSQDACYLNLQSLSESILNCPRIFSIINLHSFVQRLETLTQSASGLSLDRKLRSHWETLLSGCGENCEEQDRKKIEVKNPPI